MSEPEIASRTPLETKVETDAHWTRHSGRSSLNLQNLTRPERSFGKPGVGERLIWWEPSRLVAHFLPDHVLAMFDLI